MKKKLYSHASKLLENPKTQTFLQKIIDDYLQNKQTIVFQPHHFTDLLKFIIVVILTLNKEVDIK